jgi:hypothetical protein
VRKIGWVLIAAVALAATTLLVRRLLVTDRQRVARVVGRLQRHLERRDAASFCLLLSEDYADAHGHNRAAMREALTSGLPQLETLSMRVEALEIEVTGATARAEFVARTEARGRGRQSAWRWTTPVRLRLRKREGEWRVCAAEYRLPGSLRY